MRKDCIRLNALTDGNECNLIHFDYTSSFFFQENMNRTFETSPSSPSGQCPRPIARKQHLSCQGSAEKVLLPVENFPNCCTRIKDSAGSWSCTSAAGTVETEISYFGSETKYQSTSDCLILADWMGVYASIHLEAKLLGHNGQKSTKYDFGHSTEPQTNCPWTHKFLVKHHVQPWSQKFRLWLKRSAKISWYGKKHWGKRRRWRLDFTYYYAECVIPENHVV